jgi:hypothetical protein
MDKMQATDVRRDWRKMLDRAEHEHKLNWSASLRVLNDFSRCLPRLSR